jgi:hypothetical protein
MAYSFLEQASEGIVPIAYVSHPSEPVSHESNGRLL